MKLSTSVAEIHSGALCARCGRGVAPIVTFHVLTEAGHGETDGICTLCLGYEQSVDVPLAPLVEGPVDRRRAMKARKKRSQKQELQIAGQFDGRTQPGSGAMPWAKGDVRKKGVFRIEAKFTEAKSYSLKLEDLEKIEAECEGAEKPIFIIDYLENGTRSLRGRYAVLTDTHLEELLNESGKHR